MSFSGELWRGAGTADPATLPPGLARYIKEGGRTAGTARAVVIVTPKLLVGHM